MAWLLLLLFGVVGDGGERVVQRPRALGSIELCLGQLVSVAVWKRAKAAAVRTVLAGVAGWWIRGRRVARPTAWPAGGMKAEIPGVTSRTANASWKRLPRRDGATWSC